MSGYARPGLVASTEWLAERLDDPSIRIVDCDEWPAYQRLHIPGAVGWTVHHYLKDPRRSDYLMPPDVFAETMAEHGIGDGHTVVAYDGSGGLYATRLWWSLDYYGHPDCRVLDGGFNKWVAGGQPVTRERPEVKRARFTVRRGSDSLCTREDVQSAIDDEGTVIWDVRSPEEHTGENPRANRHGGHIPGAVNLEWLDMTTRGDAPELLPAGEMRRRLQSIGVTPDKRVFTHCQAGIRASHAAFVLRLLGFERAKNYDASWNEWGNRDDTPIVQEPGTEQPM
ncbi:MAG: sulfurtransferase [Dehalococcoidia bacterium]